MYEITITARNSKFDAPVTSIVTALHDEIRPWTEGGWSKSKIFINITTAHSEARMDADILVKIMNPESSDTRSDHRTFLETIRPICNQYKVSCHVAVLGFRMSDSTISLP